ncbi:hypothetical protein [Adlercreutzia equolifaciens]|nr:hypothetical protein [Adlercreutzia equolifaciens]
MKVRKRLYVIHWFGETVETDAQQRAEDALKSYAIVQYDQLFKDRSNR